MRAAAPGAGVGIAIVLAALAAIGGWADTAHAQGDGTRRDAPPPPPPTPVVTKAPVLLQAQAPDYPPAALAAGKQASVKVRLHLDASGLVTKVDVLEPVGDGFDEAAVAAALQYVFEPAEVDGVPAPIQVETAINFVIEQVEPVEPIEPPTPDGGADAGPPEHAGPMAKPITVEGEAVERGTRRKLAGVIVSIAELELDAVTDTGGRFYFHGVPPGTYQLIAVDQRFDRFERTVVVGKDEVVDARLWMRPRGGNPYETVVEGEREVLEVTRRTLDRQQLTSVPGTFGDPIRVISTLPGVARAPFGLGLLLIRGSNPDDTGVFLDGHSLPLLFHFLGGPSVINPEFVEGLELYPGGFPARFGRFHGGVVAIESRDAKADGIHGSADVDLLDAGGYIRVPITKNLAVAVAGRRSYLDAVLAFALPEPEPGSQRVVVPVYWDSQLRVDWDGKDKGKLSVFGITSSDRLRVIEAEEGDEETYSLNSAITFWRVIASYKRKLSDGLTLTLSPAIGQASVTFAGSQADASQAYTSLTVEQNTLAYRMRVAGRAAPWLALDAGLDLESRVTLYDATIPLTDDIRDPRNIDIPPEQIQRGVEQIGVGAYVDLGIDVTKKLKLIPSLRFDTYSLNGTPRSSVDPRLVGRYALTPTVTAKGYLGIFHQPPQPEALDDRVGNPDLDIEWAVHSGFGGEWKPTRQWTIDGEIYYIDRRDVVVFTPELVTQDDGTVERLYWVNNGRRWSYGLEAQIKREITESIYGWLSYTFSISRQSRNDAQEVFNQPPTAEPTAFDQMHNLNAVVSWKPGGGWEIGARLRAGSGRPDTPVVGATFDADTGEYLPVNGDFRSVRTKFYQQLDVRAEKTWLFNTWSIGLYLDIQNVYNYANVEATQYDYRYEDSAPVTGIPFLPTLGVRGQW
jgi:TonB family protein